MERNKLCRESNEEREIWREVDSQIERKKETEKKSS